jgi:hypothetical protein
MKVSVVADLIQRVCDACNHAEEITKAAESIALTVSGRTFRLDLCQEHYQRLWRPIEIILPGVVSAAPESTSRSSPRSSNVEDDLRCPDCGMYWSSVSALSRHRRADHGFVSYDLDEGCPYCNRRSFATRQLLSAHIHSAHRDEHLHRLTQERMAK